MPKHVAAQPFSQELESWLNKKGDKSLKNLIELFEEKAFAIIFVLMMALPALPLPTGGVTHVTELISMLGALQLIIGRRTIWLPKRWLKKDASKLLNGVAGQKLIDIIRWFERYSRPRGSWLLSRTEVRSLTGLVILVLTLAAFAAPLFSGLDTLPSLGVVIMALALILEDVLLLLVGILIGASGIALELTAGVALYKGLTHFL